LLAEEVEDQVRSIIETPSNDPAGRQVAALYGSFMDEARIDAAGVKPIQPYLDRIAGIKDRAELIRVFAANGYNMPVAVGVIPDSEDTRRYVLVVAEGGTRMPTRDHYLRQGPEFDAYRAAVQDLHHHRPAARRDRQSRGEDRAGL
jgi:endothelin-converting enzyme/putative endopeptidase